MIVKIGGSKKGELSQRHKQNEYRGIKKIAEIGGIYKFLGNMGEYAICLIYLGGWTHLPIALYKSLFGLRG